MKYLKILTISLIVSVQGITSASAHLAASKSRCEELYGPPINIKGDLLTYRTETNVIVVAEFLEGQVATIIYSSVNMDADMQHSLRFLNQVSSKDVKWTEKETKSGVTQTDTNFFDDKSPNKGGFFFVSEYKSKKDDVIQLAYVLEIKRG